MCFEVCDSLSSNNVLEEVVLCKLSASPLMKPLFTPEGWQVEKWVYRNDSVGLKWVALASTDSALNLSPL